jgi:hypothetical protein
VRPLCWKTGRNSASVPTKTPKTWKPPSPKNTCIIKCHHDFSSIAPPRRVGRLMLPTVRHLCMSTSLDGRIETQIFCRLKGWRSSEYSAFHVLHWANQIIQNLQLRISVVKALGKTSTSKSSFWPVLRKTSIARGSRPYGIEQSNRPTLPNMLPCLSFTNVECLKSRWIKAGPAVGNH